MRRLILTFALAFSLSACSTSYGVYSKADPKNNEFGYMSTYLAVIAGALIIGAAADDDDGNGGAGGGGSLY